MFGQTNAPSAPQSSLFGQPSNTSTTTTPATGLFGQPAAAPASTGGLFGTSTSTAAPPQPQQAQQTAGLFGQPAASSAQPSGGMFSNLSKPAAATPSTATSAFSFGATPAASNAPPSSSVAATTTGQPSTATGTTGAFSFGAPSTSATASTAPSTTPATAPSLPSSSLFKPPDTSAPPTISAPGTASTINAPTPTNAPTSSIQFPSSLKNKTIEEILFAWNEELENQVHEFQRQSVALLEWDKKILKNAERVGKLNVRVSEMEQLHKELEQGVSFVTTQQAELESLLDGIDSELPKMVAALGKTPQVGADADRAKTFELAETLQIQLNEISSQMTRMVNQVNTTSNPKTTSGDSQSTSNVAQILNNHFETLQWIEEQVASLQKGTLETQKLSERATAEHERLALTKNY